MFKTSKIDKYLKVEKHRAVAKEDCFIKIIKEDYKNLLETIIDEGSEDELEKGINIKNNQNEIVVNIPGYFELIFPSEMDSLKFTFPYEVQLIKHSVEETSEYILFKYTKDDTIFRANFKKVQTNISILDSLFENRIKYISDDIYELIINIYRQLSGVSNIDLVNIELIMSQLFADKNELLRFTNKEYSKKYVMNTQQSSHDFSNLLGFSYGYVNNYLTKKLSSNKTLENSYLEDIISNNYTKLENKEK